VPWGADAQVVYEHLHRYLWAGRLVAGRRVLDLASGEGFGAAILARSAAAVVGVDIDEQSVKHANLNYDTPNLTFAVGDARDLADFDEDSFGAVVAFEMIEHLGEQDRVLDEIQRVLESDGLLIISTPDRVPYDEAAGHNPFHVRELSFAEFAELLESRFTNVRSWGQRTITGSALTALGSTARRPEASQSFFIEREGAEWRVAPAISPIYIVSIASNAELPSVPSDSTLRDPGLELVREAEAKAVERLPEQLKARERELASLRREVARLQARAAYDAHTISSLDTALNAAQKRNQRIEGSVSWQLFQRVRGRVFALLGGEDSRTVQRLQSTLRFVGRKLRKNASAASRAAGSPFVAARRTRTGSIVLPEHAQPDVSIVIPLYAHAELTRAALESIADNTPHLSYEVILVDDSDDPPTKGLLRKVRGARILVNETNIGYLRSIQRGAAAARGRWLVLCNNDIEPQPGWLAAMLDCGESRPDIAIVSPKFLYPTGILAEAGAIMWRDATGANYGRGRDPTCCHYEYRREIDYGSAAALMVNADFWREVGGFDERFLPMYYEDTDLCFEARARGFRVVYEPRALVVHVEGATAGVDDSVGHKRNQEQNRPKFVEKWRERLDTEHLPNDPRNLWFAANRRRQRHVLIVDHRVPMWDRDSGSLRMRGIIETLLELGCHVVFLPDNLIPLQPYTRELQRMGVEVIYGVDPAPELATIGPHLSLAILSRPQAAGRWLDLVREHAPDAIAAYDTVDLHWLREARRAAKHAGTDSDRHVLSPEAATMRELELALIRAADVTLVVTDSERLQVEIDVPEATVRVLPNVNEVRLDVAPAHAREGVLFVGGFEHPPNIEAALALVQEVMPLVWRELPDTHVTIVGADPTPEIEALAGPLVDVTGWVQDLDPLLSSSSALVAPLSYGAGLKGKVTQALAEGLPVVTTSIGAEGLDAVDGEHLLIGEHPTELAERVTRVLKDAELWQRLSRSGQQLVAERCSPSVTSERLGQLLQHNIRSKAQLDHVS
jgi:GT2 family glycosyltransferase/SAM-dependent methyltransferase